MESFFFFNLINKSSILNFVLVRKGEKKGEPQVFPWQTGDSPRAFYYARWPVTPAVEDFLGRALGRSSVADRPGRSAELGGPSGFLPGSSRDSAPTDPAGAVTCLRAAPRSRRPGPCAAPGGRTRPGTHPAPCPGPAISRARHGVSGGTKATLWRPSPSHNRALCGPRPPGLPRRTKGAHRPLPPPAAPGPTAGRAPAGPPLAGSGEEQQRWGGREGGLGRPPPHAAASPAPGQVRSRLASCGARLQRPFEEIRVPRTFPRAGGRGGEPTARALGAGGRGARAGLREGAARGGPPAPAPTSRAGSSGPPRAQPSRRRVSACPVPAPARRSLAVLPSPAPRPLSSSLDSAWGFAGFWEIKTASNSGGALPGQTGPGGPCAPSYQPRAGAPGKGGGPSSRHPGSGEASRLRKWGPVLEILGSGRGTASVSRPGRREGPVETAR